MVFEDFADAPPWRVGHSLVNFVKLAVKLDDPTAVGADNREASPGPHAPPTALATRLKTTAQNHSSLVKPDELQPFLPGSISSTTSTPVRWSDIQKEQS